MRVLQAPWNRAEAPPTPLEVAGAARSILRLGFPNDALMEWHRIERSSEKRSERGEWPPLEKALAFHWRRRRIVDVVSDPLRSESRYIGYGHIGSIKGSDKLIGLYRRIGFIYSLLLDNGWWKELSTLALWINCINLTNQMSSCDMKDFSFI